MRCGQGLCVDGTCWHEKTCEDYGKTDCNGTCVLTQHDPAHCGGCVDRRYNERSCDQCERAYAADELCWQGRCGRVELPDAGAEDAGAEDAGAGTRG